MSASRVAGCWTHMPTCLHHQPAWRLQPCLHSHSFSVQGTAGSLLAQTGSPAVSAACTWALYVQAALSSTDNLHPLPPAAATPATPPPANRQDDWLLERDVCERFFSRVEAMYRPNPYHNNTHAADVTQTAGVILKSLSDHLGSSSSSGCCGSGGSAAAATAAGSSAPDSSSSSKAGLSKLERFAVIFASVVHDLGHPGVNNYFLVGVLSGTLGSKGGRAHVLSMSAGTIRLVSREHPLGRSAQLSSARSRGSSPGYSRQVGCSQMLIERWSTASAALCCEVLWCLSWLGAPGPFGFLSPSICWSFLAMLHPC